MEVVNRSVGLTSNIQCIYSGRSGPFVLPRSINAGYGGPLLEVLWIPVALGGDLDEHPTF